MDVIYMLQFYKTISTNFLDYVLYNSVYTHYHHTFSKIVYTYI